MKDGMKIYHKNSYIKDKKLSAVVCSHNLDFRGNNLHFLGSFRASTDIHFKNTSYLDYKNNIMVIPNRTE